MFSAKQIRLYHKENDAQTKFNVLGMHYIPRVMIIQKQSFDKELHNWPTRQHPTKNPRVDIRRTIQLIKNSPPHPWDLPGFAHDRAELLFFRRPVERPKELVREPGRGRKATRRGGEDF